MKNVITRLIGVFEAFPLSLILLLARVVIGLVFFNSGLTKIDGFAIKDSTFFLFSMEYQVPLIPPVMAAYMATFAELSMPFLLWSGLGARFAALALLGMTAVIQIFVYPEAYVTHGLWAIALLIIVRFGAGFFSLDQLIRSQHANEIPEAREGEAMWKI
ncbi:MAG: DoxX family protein [Alphaproteobacteria bacterium]|nr:DoxX family protein [Alphaproteobacteria bacterium]